jgi:4-amino-4-deoxy-L-arabinose transferase-like glycosyltransferase
MAKRIPQKAGPKTTKKSKVTQKAVDWLAPIEAFINTQAMKVAAVIFILSLGLSTVYYFQGHKSPLESLHKWHNSDMAFFDEWAQYVEGGDWKCDTVLHPFHDWHGIFAAAYFKEYPDIASTYYAAHTHDGSLDTIAAQKALINDIYKGKTFHQEPLYTYLLAITFKIFGYNYDWVFLWQFLLGAFTNVLVFFIGRKYFNAVTGLLASLFVMLSGPIMVFEMVVLRTTMTNFFTVLLFYLYLKVLEKPDWKTQLAFGASSGIALLGQSYFILFIIPALAWFAWTHWKNKKEMGMNVAAFFAALLIVMSPLFYRNASVGIPFNSLASHGAMAYIPVNTSHSSPMESFSIYLPDLVKIRHNSKGKISSAAIQCLKTFNGLGDFFRIYKQKINGMFMWFELPNNMNYYMFKSYAPILGLLPACYFYIAPLGLAGLFLGWWRYRKKFIPFLLMTLASMAPLVIAGNLARYRTPLEIMMSLSAAYLIIELAKMTIIKTWKSFSIWAALSLLFFIYTSNIVKKGLFVINPNDLDSMYSNHYMDRLIELEKQQKNEEYLALTSDMIQYLPDYFFETKVTDKIYYSNEAECCKYVAKLMGVHLHTLEMFNTQPDQIAFYKDRINILNQKAENFYKK